MRLSKEGDEVAVRGGAALLSASYSPDDGAVGTLLLRVEDQSTYDSVEAAVGLDPWTPDAWELYDWSATGVLVVCGADAIVAFDPRWRLSSRVSLEYEECDTLDSPWFAGGTASDQLLVATERRVWSLNRDGAVRWIWSCDTHDRHQWIVDAPRVDDSIVVVPVQSKAGGGVVRLTLDGGQRLRSR